MAEAHRLVDKPDKLTVSGVHCGEQRRIYDERRRALVPAHGYALLIVRTAQLTVDPTRPPAPRAGEG
jgi:hypothetical protein